MDKATVDKIRAAVAPGHLTEEDIVQGTEKILALSDDELSSLFMALTKPDASLPEIGAEYLEDSGALAVKALMRVRFVTLPIFRSIQKAQKVKADRKKRTLFGPDSDNMSILEECERSTDINVVDKLAKIAAISEKRLEAMVLESSKLGSSFMSAPVINNTLEQTRRCLEALIEYQIKTGRVEAAPEKIELQGAFQMYVAGMDETAKKNMVNLGQSFVKMVKDKYGKS